MKTNFVKNLLQDITLAKNEVRVVAIRPTVNPEKVQLVFVEEIEREGRGVNKVHSFFNRSDENFSNNTYQPVWYTAMIEDLKEFMPKAYEPAKKAQETGDYVQVNISNPTLLDDKLCIQITETHQAREADLSRGLDKAAKQDGQGNYLLKEGQLIFSRANITLKSDRKHQFITHDGTTTDVEQANYSLRGERTVESEADTKAKEAQEKGEPVDA